MNQGDIGKFIVIEGGDGAGKGTLISNLKKNLSENTVYSREPGGSGYGEEIRNLVLGKKYGGQLSGLAQFYAMWSARVDHLDKIIRPALLQGRDVVVDRFDSSTYAYQIFGQQEVDLKDQFWEQRNLVLSETKPDLYIYLDIDPVIGLARETAQDHFGARQISFHNRIRDGYKKFMKHVNSVEIDASISVEEVFQLAFEQIEVVKFDKLHNLNSNKT